MPRHSHDFMAECQRREGLAERDVWNVKPPTPEERDADYAEMVAWAREIEVEEALAPKLLAMQARNGKVVEGQEE